MKYTAAFYVHVALGGGVFVTVGGRRAAPEERAEGSLSQIHVE